MIRNIKRHQSLMFAKQIQKMKTEQIEGIIHILRIELCNRENGVRKDVDECAKRRK